MAVAWSPVIDGRDTCVPQSYADCYRKVDADFVAAADPVTIARLVAIARAALALNDARKRIAPAREALDDTGTMSARQDLNDALDDFDNCQTALDAALRSVP